MNARLTPPAGVRSKLHWNYYSVKIGGYVPCASPDSLRTIYHAEVSHEVVRYRTELESVRFNVGGRSKTYTPHLEETLIDDRVIVTEIVDMFEETHDLQHAEIVAHARAHYAARGIGFRVRPKIDEQSLFDAVEAIQTFRRTQVTAEDILRVKVGVGERNTAPLAEIRDLFKSPALGFAKLSAMTARRIIAIDLTHELGPASPIRLLNSC